MRILVPSKKTIMDEPRTEKLRPHEAKPGSMRHEPCALEFDEQIEAVYRLIGRYLRQTLEEFKAGVKAAERTVDEVATWCRIAAAWYKYHDAYLDGDRLPDHQEEKLVAALMAMSGGETDLHRLPVAAEVGARLLACLRSTA